MALLIPGIRRTQRGLILGVDGGAVGFKYAALTATGNSQSTAAELTAPVTSVATASVDGTKSVVIPTRGSYFVVYNEHATNGLPIYPPSGCTFNGGSSNAAITIEGKTSAVIWQVSDTNYAAMYTANT